MVDVFIIHSGKDYKFVKENLEPFLMGEKDIYGNSLNSVGYSNILTLQSGENKNWKQDALSKIKKAQAVIVVVGEDACEASKNKTMGWEVRQAVKYNKLIMIYNLDKYSLPNFLKYKDRFTGQNVMIAQQLTLDKIKTRIDDYAKGHYDIFSSKYKKLDEDERLQLKPEILEQYIMYQQTSEELIARRQNVNSFYLTVNSALVTLVGLILSVVDFPANMIVILFMSVIGIILDISWVNLLDAYGILNSAKMKVINLLEEQLPIILYDVEWQIMSDKLNNKKYVSFTDSEKRIPKIFTVIYITIIVLVIMFLLFKSI